MSGVDLVIPNPQSENDIKAMKALVEEMIKMNKVLIARYVYRNNSNPKSVVLSPHLSKKGPLFYLNVLPTVEDIRDYQFDSLKECTKNQEELINKFIDSLDLENDDEEELKPTETYNPTLQYFYQCLESKALNNEDDIPPLDDEISKYLVPNKKLFENNKYVSFLPKLFPIKEKDKIDEKKKRIFWKDVINEEFENKLTQEKIEEKLNSKKKKKKKTISAITPIEDFKEMIGNKNGIFLFINNVSIGVNKNSPFFNSILLLLLFISLLSFFSSYILFEIPFWDIQCFYFKIFFNSIYYFVFK